MIRRILNFYLTLSIPLLYGLNLLAITIITSSFMPIMLRAAGLAASGIGLMLWGLSYLTLGKSFGVLPEPKIRVTKGIYGVWRHPMYIGIILTFGGLAVANNSVVGIGFTIVVMLPLLWFRAKKEEVKLM